MPTNQQSLLDIVTTLKTDLVSSFKSANRIATGNTESQLETIATETSAQLTAPYWIYALQDGRKPTRPDAPKGNPTLFEAIQEWCDAKGISRTLAYPIAKHIHKFGYPGTPGIIDGPLSEENVDKAMSKSLNDLALFYLTKVARSINTNSNPELITA